MITNANPSPFDFDETLHAIRYGNEANRIRVARASSANDRMAATHGYNGRRIRRGKRPSEALAGTAAAVPPVAPAAVSGRASVAQAQPRRRMTRQSTRTRATMQPRIAPVAEVPASEQQQSQSADALHELQDTVEQLRLEKAQLEKKLISARNDLETVEADLRSEFAEELSRQMSEFESMLATGEAEASAAADARATRLVELHEMRTTGKTKRTMARIAESDSDASPASSSAAAVQELTEQLHECEEEIERMREQHEEEITELSERLHTFETDAADVNSFVSRGLSNNYAEN